ncbi:hypothetical protein F8D52_06050 [Chryseobacterium viscerum]|uniref:HTH luxR-type domain-containing protein n=2 Tax=Chryseobacterium viscerum TaxID=1037377 RepID=A0A5N4BSG5_9FLAO|nr:hypothetical protein F8D52_06050 [Chryseobacterium viscerum]
MVKIDTLLNRADHSMQIDFAHSLQLSKQSLIKAEKVDDSEKRARSYLYIARSLVFLRRFDECSSYLEKGLQERSVQQNVVLKASFLAVQARYYSRMSLSEQAYQNNLEVLDLLRLRTDLDSKLIMCNMYIDIADYYTELKDYKKAHVYADQSIAASEKIPMKEYLSAKRIYREKAFIYFYKSWIYLKEKKSALAYPFIQKGYNQAVLEKYKYLAPFYEAYGDYYFQVHNYKYAIDFYLKSMENKKQFMQNSAYVDSKIAESFKLLDDREKEIYYLQKAEAQHKLDMNDDKRIVQKELDRILEKKQIEKSDLMKSNTLIFLAIIFIFIILLIGISMRHQKIRNKKKEIIGEQNVMLSEKELEIEAREEKIEKLQKKVTESFSELSDLVKGNSSQFWGRFQEVYPDFCTKILEINPMLKASELTFCAYIYMGLSTKEVAEYTFKAPKTIENKRYNLRKRLGLSPEEDFVVWIRKYIDGIR